VVSRRRQTAAVHQTHHEEAECNHNTFHLASMSLRPRIPAPSVMVQCHLSMLLAVGHSRLIQVTLRTFPRVDFKETREPGDPALQEDRAARFAMLRGTSDRRTG
jgi:hypothetical protein